MRLIAATNRDLKNGRRRGIRVTISTPSAECFSDPASSVTRTSGRYTTTGPNVTFKIARRMGRNNRQHSPPKRCARSAAWNGRGTFANWRNVVERACFADARQYCYNWRCRITAAAPDTSPVATESAKEAKMNISLLYTRSERANGVVAGQKARRGVWGLSEPHCCRV